ncbi:MAG: endonuclease III [Nitrospirota bacterium]|nr:endonuclease III [Nitrospirota bacterium]MDH4360762.1 endonuclease III [Nitrospirota bacterium]MDH5296557.1 endonuclease III [Nitrospirota bacterium]MDH5576065.1 endonuclease III [Nitrospirota bacterium]
MRALASPPFRTKAPRRSIDSPAVAKKRAARILAALGQSIPDAKVELDSSNSLELLMATILSAQCTDERVNQVTPRVFSRFRTAEDYANADRAELEALIRPTGFFKNKARHLIGCGQALIKHFNGRVPETMEALTSLPGVGRKTANVILGSYVGEPVIVVDTHVKRVANRLGLTKSPDPTKIEQDLQHLFPKAQWTVGAQRLLLHGRYVCLARRPNCQNCVLYTDCGWEGKRKPI